MLAVELASVVPLFVLLFALPSGRAAIRAGVRRAVICSAAVRAAVRAAICRAGVHAAIRAAICRAAVRAGVCRAGIWCTGVIAGVRAAFCHTGVRAGDCRALAFALVFVLLAFTLASIALAFASLLLVYRAVRIHVTISTTIKYRVSNQGYGAWYSLVIHMSRYCS